jgi:hypothetical protein
METIDGFERHMREVLHGADDQAAGFTAAQVIDGGRHRRRARTAAVSGVALVAAGAVAVVPSALVGGQEHGHGSGSVVAAGGPTSPGSVTPTSAARVAPGPPASSPTSSPVTSSTSAAAPKVRVVAPGTVDIGGGYTLTLTSDSETLSGHDGQNGPHYTDNGNQSAGSIGLQTDGPMVTGLYIGRGEAVSGTVTMDGKSYPATVVTLAGHPGWSVAYAMLPSSPKVNAHMSISVSDATGHQLASFADPPPAH